MRKFPLARAFTFLEPGPVILVCTADEGRRNLMTLSWTMVLDFFPRFAFMTGPWNYSYKALRKSRECVIAVPAADMMKTVVSIGTCSGREVDKFEKFGLTPLEAEFVAAPLVKECYANIECRVVDYIRKHGIFILEAVAAWVGGTGKERRFFHAVGDGRFIIDGEKIDHRKLMRGKLPDGVRGM